MFDSVKAEKDASELLSLMYVINNRLSGMTSEEFKLLSTDAELWRTVSQQLKAASTISFAIFRNCTNLQP